MKNEDKKTVGKKTPFKCIVSDSSSEEILKFNVSIRLSFSNNYYYTRIGWEKD